MSRLTHQQAKAVAYEVAWQALDAEMGKGLVAVSVDCDEDLAPLEAAFQEIIDALRKRAEGMAHHIPDNYYALTHDYLVKSASALRS